ncbi:hypothetical protein VPH35_036985 [Triticum aestivum]
MTSPPRSIKESFSRWWMLDATEDHMCIAGSFNLAVQLPSSSDFTGGAAMALCSSHIRSPEPELSGLLQRTLLTSRPTSSCGVGCCIDDLEISADMGSKALRASDKSCLSSISKMATWSRLTVSLKAIKVKRGIKLLKPLLPFVDCSCLLVTAFATAEGQTLDPRYLWVLGALWGYLNVPISVIFFPF